MAKTKVIVSGSIAYDILYKYPRDFSESLIQDGTTALAVSFVVDSKNMYFGGCAGNIAFGMKRLGAEPVVIGMAGKDFAQYSLWMDEQKISTDSVLIEKDEFTSQATVITDTRGQQIAFFHEGAPANARKRAKRINALIAHHARDAALMHIGPNNKAFILSCISQATRYSIPFLFDPGQVLPLFSRDELDDIIPKAFGLAVNEYELHILCRILKKTTEEIIEATPLLLLTMAEKGSRIYFNGDEIAIPAVKVKRVVDPTGCGDAYRGAFLSTIAAEMPKLTREVLLRAGKLGSRLAAMCLSHCGTQTY